MKKNEIALALCLAIGLSGCLQSGGSDSSNKDNTTDNTTQNGNGTQGGGNTVSDLSFTTSSNIDVIEQLSSAAVTIEATNSQNNSVTYYLNGGADEALFTINSSTGELSFKQLPDFEVPVDSDQNNVYEVTIGAWDGIKEINLYLSVNILDLNEVMPFISSAPDFNVYENSTSAAGRVIASDLEGDVLSFSLSGGADKALFSIDSASGQFRFISTPDYENPIDVDANNIYEFTVSVSDGTNVVDQNIAVSVLDLAENGPAISSSSSFSLSENSTVVGTLVASDTSSGNISYTAVGGLDNALFSVNYTTGEIIFITAPDFENPQDSNSDNTYELVIAASNGSVRTEQALSISVTDVNDVSPVVATTSPLTILENSTSVVTLAATDADSSVFTYTLTGGADQAAFTLDANTGLLSFSSVPDFEIPGDANNDNQYEITVTVSDGVFSSNKDLLVNVGNVAETTISGTTVRIEQSSTTVTWQAPIDDEAGASISPAQIAGYRVYLGTNINNLSLIHDTADSTITSYDVTGLSNGTYYLGLSAYDSNGVESSMSNIYTINVVM